MNDVIQHIPTSLFNISYTLYTFICNTYGWYVETTKDFSHFNWGVSYYWIIMFFWQSEYNSLHMQKHLKYFPNCSVTFHCITNVFLKFYINFVEVKFVSAISFWRVLLLPEISARCARAKGLRKLLRKVLETSFFFLFLLSYIYRRLDSEGIKGIMTSLRERIMERRRGSRKKEPESPHPGVDRRRGI